MNSRERFLRTMRFEEVDHFFYWGELAWWGETIERWQKEGLPKDVHIWDYFGFERKEMVPLHQGMIPEFEFKMLEETDKYKVSQGGDGVIKKEFKEHSGMSMPQFLEFPVKNRHDFEEMKKRYNPASPVRYPLWWPDLVRYYQGRDYPLGICTGSYFGWIRAWVGMENLAVMFYDDPGLVAEMMNFMADFIVATIKPVLKDVQVDYAAFWEDMAYKTASLISPQMFRKFMIPCYRKVTDVLHQHGVDICLVDSDGNIDELIPLWLEVGVNGVYPLEISAGMDPVKLRKKYGKSLIMLGGIDKKVLAQDKKTIEKEVLSKVPWLLTQGGYIPTLDHSVPPDIPLENYLYYLDLIKKVAMNPEKYL